MTVLVASTVAPYKLKNPPEATAWLAHAEAWRERGHEFFLAAEAHCHMAGGRFDQVVEEWGAYDLLTTLLSHLGAQIWHFAVDDGERELTGGGRLVRICTGRNLVHELFNRSPGRWEAVLFLDTDTEPPEDAPERLLEVDHQLVGFHVPTYCLDGPRVGQLRDGAGEWYSYVGASRHLPQVGHVPSSVLGRPNLPFFPEGADVREHWNTAGALFVRDEAARHLRWRYDLSRGQTDDPCFQEDAVARGYGQTWVRHDVVGRHHPDVIQPLENRGHDLRL